MHNVKYITNTYNPESDPTPQVDSPRKVRSTRFSI